MRLYQQRAPKPKPGTYYRAKKLAKKENSKEQIDIDDLENQLLGKYGASKYSDVEDWDEEDEKDYKPIKDPNPARTKRKIEGFESVYQQYKQNDDDKKHEKVVTTVTTIDSSNRNSIDSIKTPQRKSLFDRIGKKTNNDDYDDDISSLEDTMNDGDRDGYEGEEIEDDFEDQEGIPNPSKLRGTSIPTTSEVKYRLRKPKYDPDRKTIAEMAALNAARLEEKEEKRRKRRELKRQMDKEESKFIEFSFENGEKLFNKAEASLNTDTSVEVDTLDLDEDVQVDDKTDTSSSIFTTATFEEIGVDNEQILKNLQKMQIYGPTNIQEVAVPNLSQGRHTIIKAQTGSGKTLAFLLPLAKLLDPNIRKIQCFILAPSRELVLQISDVAEVLFKDTGIRSLGLIGGANVRGQLTRLRERKPQIVVATPGRLAEMVFRLEKVKLGMIRAVIVDEVDNLINEPYLGELQMLIEATPVVKSAKESLFKMTPSIDTTITTPEIVNLEDDEEEEDEDEEMEISESNIDIKTPINRVLCLASATADSPGVTRLADSLVGVGNHHKVDVQYQSDLPTSITHGLISCAQIKALENLRRFLQAGPEIQAALIFVNNPHRVEVVCDQLWEYGITAAPLHGDSSKDDRKEVLSRLRDGRLKLVVTTEMASRGLDFPNLTHVINFELPTDAAHYVHRAGRCGRAGRPGLVMNFARPNTKFVVRRFGKQLGVKVRDAEIKKGKLFLKYN